MFSVLIPPPPPQKLWFDSVVQELRREYPELSEERAEHEALYVEIGYVLNYFLGVETFDRACGRPPRPLPHAAEGEPTRVPPTELGEVVHEPQQCYYRFVRPESSVGSNGEIFRRIKGSQPGRGVWIPFSMLPGAFQEWFRFGDQFYMDVNVMDGTDELPELTSLNRAEIELLAARVSELNSCDF